MRVHVPSPLRSYTGASVVEAQGATLMALVDDLERRYPGIKFRIVDEQDAVRPHIKFFVGDEHNDDLSAPLPEGVTVHIVAALSGG